MPTTHHERTNIPLTAPPDTDIWRKPPAHDVFSVSPLYFDLPPFTPNQLARALITFTGAWKHQFDQAGLVLLITEPGADAGADAKPSWIKTGVEFFDGQPYLSFVGCDRWADWSISPVRAKGGSGAGAGAEVGPATSIELTVEGGTTLWAREVVLDAAGEVLERYPVRECTWPLHDEGAKRVRIGAYACRPAKRDVAGDELLQAHVERLVVELREA